MDLIMIYKIGEFRDKEVININDGTNYGRVCDMEFDTESARLISIVVFGRRRLLGIFGRDDDIVITWENIKVIGNDTILVHHDHAVRAPKKKHSGFFEFMFG